MRGLVSRGSVLCAVVLGLGGCDEPSFVGGPSGAGGHGGRTTAETTTTGVSSGGGTGSSSSASSGGAGGTASSTTGTGGATTSSGAGGTTSSSSSSTSSSTTSSTTPQVCTPSATQPCYDGPAGTQGSGPCKGGNRTCATDGSAWGPCVGEVVPQSESGHCGDGVDNDCNGKVDCQDPACLTAPSCCVPSTGADGTIWANSLTTLYRVDPTTFAVTTVGDFNNGDQMVDIAVAPTGALYGVSFSAVYSINKVTGAATLVTTMAATGNASLTFLTNGNLLMADNSGSLRYINPTTGALTTIGNLGNGLVSTGDLVAVGNAMYSISSTNTGGSNASTNNLLLRVDAVTGPATVVGATGYGNIWGLAYSQAHVIGFTGGGDILRIDPATGASTLVSHQNIQFWGAGQSPLVDNNACP